MRRVSDSVPETRNINIDFRNASSRAAERYGRELVMFTWYCVVLQL